MIPQRTFEAECEISTGTLSVMKIPPLFTGEASALAVSVSLKNNGSAYTPASGVTAEMYLYFPNTENMTQAVSMTISGNTVSGVLPASQTGIDGYPLLVIQLTDATTGAIIVAASYQLHMRKARGQYILTTEAPNPSEIIYIGRAPYINSTTYTWMVWDNDLGDYVDTNINAIGTGARSVNSVLPDQSGNIDISETNIPSTQFTGKTNIGAALKYVNDERATLESNLRAGTAATAGLHLGFYLDSNGDLVQVDD